MLLFPISPFSSINLSVVSNLLNFNFASKSLYSNALKLLSIEKSYFKSRYFEFLYTIDPNKFELVLFKVLLLGIKSSFLSLKTVPNFASK